MPPFCSLQIFFAAAFGSVLFFSNPVMSQRAPAATATSLILIPGQKASDSTSIGLVPEGVPLPEPRKEMPDVLSPSSTAGEWFKFPWKTEIVATVFWAGEKPTPRNPVSNRASAWDPNWAKNFGGFDDPDPDKREGWIPKAFVPKQNPFYVALPYNDTRRQRTKDSARKNIPWFEDAFYREGKTVVKGRWIAIRNRGKICYGQWEDVGPFETDDWEYVFGKTRPKTKGNGGAGLDVSPAIRDYLGFKNRAVCDWRFVEVHEVPDGPWKTWGSNNPFANRTDKDGQAQNVSESLEKLRELRDILLENYSEETSRDSE